MTMRGWHFGSICTMRWWCTYGDLANSLQLYSLSSYNEELNVGEICYLEHLWRYFIHLQAYLAYGVPRSDIKLFSLMQKVCSKTWSLLIEIVFPLNDTSCKWHATNFIIPFFWCFMSNIGSLSEELNCCTSFYSRLHIQSEGIHSVLLSLNMLFWRWDHQTTGHRWYGNCQSSFWDSCLFWLPFVHHIQTVDSFLCLLFKALLLALQKIKVPEEQKKFCIAAPESLLTFALSCGMYSSPAVS